MIYFIIFSGGDSFEISTESFTPAQIRAYEGQRGQYIVRYTFLDAGAHSISILMNGEHIGNSPVAIVQFPTNILLRTRRD